MNAPVAFPDPAAGTAEAARAEVEQTPLYAELQALLQKAEDIFCKAATREDRLSRRDPYRRPSYSMEEMLADHLLNVLGHPVDPCGEVLERFAELQAEAERRACW